MKKQNIRYKKNQKEAKTEKISSKSQYITLLSVISAISVVILHTNGRFWVFSTEPYWFSANIIECVFYFAVPVFFMISGATLIDYQDKYSTKEFFVKRIKKTVIPFVAWSFIGIAYRMKFDGWSNDFLNYKSIINAVLGTSIVDIYWFFPALFCVYLCMPLFAAVEKNKRKETFSYLAIAGFAINILINFASIKNWLGIEKWPFSVSVISGYLFYVIVGYLLSHYEVPIRGGIVIYVLSVCGLLIHIVGTYNLSIEAGKIVSTYKGYNNVPCILYSVGIFLFFKNYGDSIMASPVGKIVRFMGDYTFGIYLMHIYFKWRFEYYLSDGTLGFDPTSLIYRLGAPVIIIPITILLTYVIRKIPVLRRIMP